MSKKNDVLIELAKLMRKHDLTIGDFYSILGIDLGNVAHSEPDLEVQLLAGIFTGWENPPSDDD